MSQLFSFGGIVLTKAFVGAYVPRDVKTALMQKAIIEKTKVADILRKLLKRELALRK